MSSSKTILQTMTATAIFAALAINDIDEMNQMFQAQSDAENAAIQAMNNANAAAAAQWQNDLINATAPVGPQ